MSSPPPGHSPGHPWMKDRLLSSGHATGPASLFIGALSPYGSCSMPVTSSSLLLPGPFGRMAAGGSIPKLELTHPVTAPWTTLRQEFHEPCETCLLCSVINLDLSWMTKWFVPLIPVKLVQLSHSLQTQFYTGWLSRVRVLGTLLTNNRGVH